MMCSSWEADLWRSNIPRSRKETRREVKGIKVKRQGSTEAQILVAMVALLACTVGCTLRERRDEVSSEQARQVSHEPERVGRTRGDSIIESLRAVYRECKSFHGSAIVRYGVSGPLPSQQSSYSYVEVDIAFDRGARCRVAWKGRLPRRSREAEGQVVLSEESTQADAGSSEEERLHALIDGLHRIDEEVGRVVSIVPRLLLASDLPWSEHCVFDRPVYIGDVTVGGEQFSVVEAQGLLDEQVSLWVESRTSALRRIHVMNRVAATVRCMDVFLDGSLLVYQ